MPNTRKEPCCDQRKMVHLHHMDVMALHTCVIRHVRTVRGIYTAAAARHYSVRLAGVDIARFRDNLELDEG